VSFGRRFDQRFSLRLSAGAVLGGDVEGDGRYDVGHGFLGSLTGAARWFGGGNEKPFLVTTLAAGASHTTTTALGSERTDGLTAIDVRGGAQLGITLFRAWSPYLVARAFGGPIAWRGLTGSDRHHYALGFGTSANAGRFDLVFDATLLGERAVSWGAGMSF